MNTKISLSGEVLEEVESFVYLGSIFTCDGNCTQDIRKKLAMGRSTMQSLSPVWKSNDISTTTKANKKAVLPQGNRAMPRVFFSVEVCQQYSLQV